MFYRTRNAFLVPLIICAFFFSTNPLSAAARDGEIPVAFGCYPSTVPSLTVVTFTVTLDTVTNSDRSVATSYQTSDDMTIVAFPTSATVPAGQKSGSFTAMVIGDEGDSATVTATLNGYSAQSEVSVQ